MSGGELLILIIPAGVALLLLTLLSLEHLLLTILFLVPLSLQLSYLTGSAGPDLSLPTEPVLALLLLITLFRLLVTRQFPRALLHHPVSWLIALYLVWTLVTAITSEMPLVSFKTLAYRLWFIAGFYLVTARLSYSERFRKRAIISFSAGLSVVVIYFLVRVGGAGLLNQQFAHSACYPFYNDHTSFGASMAFLIPPLVVMTLYGRGVAGRGLPAAMALLFMAGLVISYSRAAWVSLMAALVVMAVLRLRLPPRVLVTMVVVLGIAAAAGAGYLRQQVESTTEDSSTDMKQHLRSSANISTDESNLERINRWNSALRMFRARPHTGWGPGTYQFCYAPFQKGSEKTSISTNFGDAGNAHSEYLGALSESGWPGALLFIAVTIAATATATRAWYRRRGGMNGFFALAVATGLMTYVVHGVMNSFLDTDKIAALWWGFMAMAVAMDLERETGGAPAGGLAWNGGGRGSGRRG